MGTPSGGTQSPEPRREGVRVGVAVLARPARDPLVEVLLHRGVDRLEGGPVAVAPVALPRHDEPERVPGRRRAAALHGLERRLADVAVVLVARREERHLARLGLRVEHVLEHLPVEPLGVEEERRRPRGELRVARPAVLLVDGCVGDDAVQVALDGPRGVAVDAVQRLVVGLERAGCGELASDLLDPLDGGLDAGGQGRPPRSAQLDVLEPLVAEARRPALVARGPSRRSSRSAAARRRGRCRASWPCRGRRASPSRRPRPPCPRAP